ncbi:DUF6452 family protein [Planktosalinus lacus]|uniref:Lipoprotein n=1 Tax=Planktosalinus lacus TaxID=1526573 RepID=A0A8J2VAR0_9FLAO|nr:DUF6452 family protein [Planktosalinus lacus]GGD92777.1 hypothetical protein GCM10011312_15720 [Planktosalinus lacus]
MIKKLFLLISLFTVLQGCTRDDICPDDTSKTPLLIIKFFNAENPEAPKEVQAFTVIRPEDEFSLFAPVTIDSISIPLLTNTDLTDYYFISNANDSIQNIDFVSFTYERSDEYINRACGFRTNFTDLNFQLAPASQQSWISQISIQNDSINARNQNEAHLYIYH